MHSGRMWPKRLKTHKKKQSGSEEKNGSKLGEKRDVTNLCYILSRRKGWNFAGPQSLDFLFYSFLHSGLECSWT